MQEQNNQEKKQAKSSSKKTPSLLFTVNKKGEHRSRCMTFLRLCILPIVRIFYPFKMVGESKVPNGACVYVCNHYRMIDPMYLLPTTKEGIHFIAKKEASTIPVLGFFTKKVKTIFVNRDGNDVRAIIDAQKCLKNGDKIAIYPEGKRNKTSEIFLPFNSGSALIAIRAKAPIIPVVLYKKARFLRRNIVLVGAPLVLDEYYDAKLTEDVLKAADAKIFSAMSDLRQNYETEKLAKGKR